MLANKYNIKEIMYLFKKIFFTIFIFFSILNTTVNAEVKKFNMVFVPASEKGDENDYEGLVEIVNKLTGFEINFIKVTDYNAAVEAMRADRVQIAWYGGKTYIKAAEIANAEAFAAGVRPGEKDAGYFSYFVVKKESNIKNFSDIKGKVLSLNSIGSTSGDLIPQVEIAKINLSIKDKEHFKNVFYAGSHDACLLAVLNNKADVCGMSSRNFEARLADNTFKIEDVRIIHKSEKVPPPPLAYSKKIPLEDRKKIKSAVLKAHKYGEIGGYGGTMSHYISVSDSDYDVLRNVVKLLNKKK